MTRRFWLAAIAAFFTIAVCVKQVMAMNITTAAINFPGVTLDGTDQIVTGSTNAWQADATGESGGWNISIASTDFNNGTGKTIAVSNFEIKLQDAKIVMVSGDINGPVSTQTSFTPLGGTALKIASAAVSEGNGVYSLTPDFRLAVPAETYQGSYTATVTVAVNSGP